MAERSDVRERAAWSVVVAYEDSATREEAAKFCDVLEARFHGQCKVNITWWAYSSIEAPDQALNAADQATAADLIVFAARPEGEMPKHIKSWVEGWLQRRQGREGALVGLLEQTPGSFGPPAPCYVYLRAAAHRGALDYFTEASENLFEIIPESIEFYSERASQTSNVLDEILRSQVVVRRPQTGF